MMCQRIKNVIMSIPMMIWKSRIVPPEADSGSAVKNIWWIRSEKLLKVNWTISIKIETDSHVSSISDQVVAYILAFLIILCGSIASKGTLVFMLKQVVIFSSSLYVLSKHLVWKNIIFDIIQISLVQTNLPFCNKKTESTQWVPDTIGRNFEVIQC